MAALFSLAQHVRTHDYDRYLCALFAPQHPRQHLFVLYAFNNELAKIKDITSEPMTGYIRLQWWREAVEELYANRPRNHEIVLELHHVAGHGMPKERLLQLIDYREQEIEYTHPATMEALETYARETSSALLDTALLSIHALDSHSQKAAEHIGIAWAITGFLRSTRHYAGKRRIFFPQTLLDAHHITTDDVAEGRHLEQTRPIVQALVNCAKEHLAEARKLTVSGDALPVLLVATLADLYLNRITQAKYDVFHTNLAVSPLKLQWRIFWNALRGKV